MGANKLAGEGSEIIHDQLKSTGNKYGSINASERKEGKCESRGDQTRLQRR